MVGAIGGAVATVATVAAAAGGTAGVAKAALDSTLGKVNRQTGKRQGNPLRNSIQGKLDTATGMDVKRDLADFDLMQEAQRSMNDPTYQSPLSEVMTDFRGQNMSQLDKGKLLHREKNPPRWSGVDNSKG
jgi:hypothetical protein